MANSGTNVFHINLAGYFASKPLYLDGENFNKPNTRKLVEQPWQELEAAKISEKQFENNPETNEEREKCWDNVTNTLCNLDFIQAKAAAKLAYELVEDFNSALLIIPENQEHIHEEKKRQTRIEKYTHDLIAYAKGQITIEELEISESITPLTEEQTQLEIERIKTNPNRADRLKDFKIFLGQETCNLQNYAYKFPKLAYQQAWNYSDSGPVGNEADKALNLVNQPLLLCSYEARPKWNCYPQFLLLLKGHYDTVFSVSITPNGKKAFSGSRDRTCIIWDLENGKPIKVLTGHIEPVTAVDMTPDGRYAISGSLFDDCILWDLVNFKAVHILKSHRYEDLSKSYLFERFRWLFALAISPDGKYGITGSIWNHCILWDLNSGKILQTLKGHTHSISSLYISPNGEKAISGSLDKTCILWDLNTGQPLLTLIEHEDQIKHVWMSTDCKKAITWSADNTVIHWDLVTGTFLKKIKLPYKCTSAMSISKDGQTGVFAENNDYLTQTNSIFRVFNLNSGNVTQTVQRESNQNWTISMIHDGSKAISGGQDKSCIFWNLNKHSEDANLVGTIPNTNFHLCAHTPNGRIVIFSSGNNSCCVWDTILFKEIKTLRGHTEIINYISISPNGNNVLTSSSDTTCILWDIRVAKAIFILKAHKSEVNCVKFTPDGKRAVSSSSDGSCILWDLLSGKIIQALKGHASSIENILITSDGRFAIYSCSHKIFIWNIISGNIENYSLHNYDIRHLEVTPDNKFIISEDNENNCIVWKISSGEIFYTLNSVSPSRFESSQMLNDGTKFIDWQITHSNQLIRTSPKGRKAISLYENKIIIVWDLKSKQILQVIFIINDIISNIEYSIDGNLILITYKNQNEDFFVYDLLSGKTITGYFSNKESKSPIFTSNGILLISRQSSNLTISNMPLSILSTSYQIITIRQIWDFEVGNYLSLLADCPSCSHRFEPTASVLDTIQTILKNANLRYEQSPWLELPDEAWEDPGLLGECPNCRVKLKFSPFLVYDYEDEEEKRKEQEEENKYKLVFENAETAFNMGNWDTALRLYLSLIKAERFDANYMRFKLAICKIKSLTEYKAEIVSDINELIGLLKENNDMVWVQSLEKMMSEKLESLSELKRQQELELAKKFKEVFRNAEAAFNNENWDTAFRLYLSLIQAEKFDANYMRFNMAICRINSLKEYEQHMVSTIKAMITMLKENNEIERVQALEYRLLEKLNSFKKLQKPWWKKIF